MRTIIARNWIDMIAAVIFDSGMGKVTGYSVGGRKDMVAAVRDALEPVARLGVKDFTTDVSMDTDNFDFLIEGVPTLVANQEPANYMLNYHAASDTFDKVDITELKRHVAIAAITAFALADNPEANRRAAIAGGTGADVPRNGTRPADEGCGILEILAEQRARAAAVMRRRETQIEPLSRIIIYR